MRNRHSEATGYAILLFAGAIWGTSGFFVRHLTAMGAPGEWITFLRLFPGFLVLLAFVAAARGLKALRIPVKSILACLAIGVICQGLFNLCYVGAVARLGMAVTVVMMYLNPVITAVLTRIFFKESFTAAKTAAIFVNIAGCVLMVTGGDFSGSGLPFMGILLGLGTAACASLSPVLARIAINDVPADVTMTWSFLAGSLTALVTIIINGSGHEAANILNPMGIFYVACLALFPTLVTFTLYYLGIARIKETSRVPILTSTEPVMATVLGIVAFHEPVGLINVLGVGLVLLSIVIMNLKKPARKDD